MNENTDTRTNDQVAAPGIKTKPKWKKGVIILVVVIVVMCILGAFIRSVSGPVSGSYDTPNSEYIAIMTVEGEIGDTSSSDGFSYSTTGYNHQWILDRIDELIYDENNAGLVLFVDTPGGSVYETDELYLKLKEYQDNTERPYYVAMGSMAASGGYYIAAGADKIFANRNTWTGSIGVTMGTFIDISEFLEDHGINTTTIDSGDNKSMGSYFDPMTDEQSAILQSLIDEAYEQFTAIIAKGRDMDLETVKILGDGRIYTAKQAVENGLIDEIGTKDEAVDDMIKEYNLYDPETVEIYYEEKPTFLERLLFTFSSLIPEYEQGDIGSALEAAEKYNNQPIKYLYEQ